VTPPELLARPVTDPWPTLGQKPTLG
jgi:hypothetical protein